MRTRATSRHYHFVDQDVEQFIYEESYDWWTLAIAFDYSEEQVAELKKYEFDGEDDVPPIPAERSHGKDIIEQFSNMLE